jgi:hypothetical protein
MGKIVDNSQKPVLDDWQLSLSIVSTIGWKSTSSRTRRLEAMDISYLHESLARYSPFYHYITDSDVVNGVIKFAVTEKASIIIVVARHYGFLNGLFHSSITHKIAYHTPIPLLILHIRRDNAWHDYVAV